MFNLRQLKAFVSVVDNKSFTQAAKSLYMTQPAVSAQLKSLEERLGVMLLERYDKNVALTEEGKIFYDEAKKILSIFQGFIDTMGEIKGIRRGKLCIGASTIPGEYIIPRLLGNFGKKYPGLQLSMKISDTGIVVEQVLRRTVDVGFIGAQVKNEALELEDFIKDQLVIIGAPDLDEKKKEITIDELTNSNLILREAESGTRMVICQQLKNLGIDPEKLKVVMELGSTRAVISAVESGMGISIVSRFAAENALALGRISEIKINGVNFERVLYLAWNKYKYQSHAVKAFLDYVRTQKDCAN